MEQASLLENIVAFTNKSRPRSKHDQDKKQSTFDSINAPYEGPKLILNTFKSWISPLKKHKEKD